MNLNAKRIWQYYRWGLNHLAIPATLGSFIILAYNLVENTRFAPLFPNVQIFVVFALIVGSCLSIYVGHLYMKYQLKTDNQMNYGPMVETIVQQVREVVKEELQKS